MSLGAAEWIRARHAEGALQHPAQGDGLLSVAVEHNRADMLRLLLELGFDADERKRVVGGDEVYETRGIPLERAAGKGHIEMAQLLLEHGADPNGPSEGGGTPMSSAYRRRDRPMLELLGRHGGVVSAVTAAYHGDIAIARLEQARIEVAQARARCRGIDTPPK